MNGYNPLPTAWAANKSFLMKSVLYYLMYVIFEALKQIQTIQLTFQPLIALSVSPLLDVLWQLFWLMFVKDLFSPNRAI